MAANLTGAADVRKNSVGAVEITDSKGRRKTVQLEDLSAADRELAEKFGYKPVCIFRFRRRLSSF
jgi:hypothetical protein